MQENTFRDPTRRLEVRPGPGLYPALILERQTFPGAQHFLHVSIPA